jgi:hypothetical protein
MDNLLVENEKLKKSCKMHLSNAKNFENKTKLINTNINNDFSKLNNNKQNKNYNSNIINKNKYNLNNVNNNEMLNKRCFEMEKILEETKTE